MSAWRRVAIAKVPRLRQQIERAERVGMLWVELWLEFVRAHSEPVDEELIGQVYDYAWWCANSPDPLTSNAGILSFYEDLPLDPGVRARMARWLPAEDFTGMGEIFRYHLSSYDDYRAFVQEFYEQRERLGDAAARSGEEPLSGEALQARVSEAVTSLQKALQERGDLQFGFMARVCIVENKEVMARLAPAFRQHQGDAHTLAAVITPILQSLTASGAVPFPADPLTIAAAALLLSSRGHRSVATRGKQSDRRK